MLLPPGLHQNGGRAPIDLVGIEAIRRFFPSIYPTIRANPQHLTDKRKDFFEEDRKSEKFYKDLDQDVDKLKEAKALRALLNWLFPKYAAHSGDRSAIFFGSRRPAQGSALERSMRICVADYFEVYFRASVPEEMFSNTDLEAFIKELNAAPRERSVGSAFNKIFDATPKGHPKRNDFLWRLSRKLDRLDDIPAESLAYAVATRAKDYTYDSLGLGEFGHALAIVFSAAQKISATGAIQRLLEGAVARASDDAFAFNLLDNVENRERNRMLTDFTNVDASGIQGAFLERMRKRYSSVYEAGPPTSQLGWWAFRRWAEHSQEDRQIEQDFWRGFIGSSRKKLAQAIDFIYPSVLWRDDPTAAVDALFPLAEIKVLLAALAEEDLDNTERLAIERMTELLRGRYQTSPGMDYVNVEPKQTG